MHFPAGPSTRLIPEMNFVCSGTIVGYTAALLGPPGHQGPIIQVWRKYTTYYKTSVDIAINNSSCDGGLTIIGGVFHCSLNLTTTRVTVEPGDILGLELPVEQGLAFARVSSGPTNYMFNTGKRSLISMSSSAFSRYYLTGLLPQINLKVGTGKCISSLW